jgi:hypothetical protein
MLKNARKRRTLPLFCPYTHTQVSTVTHTDAKTHLAAGWVAGPECAPWEPQKRPAAIA